MCGEFPESSKKIWRFLEATQIKTDERERHKYFRHISKVHVVDGLFPHGLSGFFFGLLVHTRYCTFSIFIVRTLILFLFLFFVPEVFIFSFLLLFFVILQRFLAITRNFVQPLLVAPCECTVLVTLMFLLQELRRTAPPLTKSRLFFMRCEGVLR